MPEAQTLKTASDFIHPVPEAELVEFTDKIFGEASTLFNQIHYSTTRLIVKNPVSGIQICAKTQNGQPFFWHSRPDNYKVTTASQFGLWELSPELTGILTTATTLLRIIESYEERDISLSCAQSLLDRYEGLISDGQNIAAATGYGEVFAEILD